MIENGFDKEKQEQMNEQESLNKFDNAGHRGKPQNQNQQHNVRREGTARINQNR